MTFGKEIALSTDTVLAPISILSLQIPAGFLVSPMPIPIKRTLIIAHVTALVRMDVGVTTTAVRLVVDDTGWAARLFWDVGLCVERSEHAASSGLAPL